MVNHLEISGKLTTILFDKTGTLTKGKPEVTDIIGFEIDKNEILTYTASVEARSEHPLANAVVKKPRKKDWNFLKLMNSIVMEVKV